MRARLIQKAFVTVEVRPFRLTDAPSLSEIVRRCLCEINSRDYSAEIIDRMCAHFTSGRFVELSTFRSIYVAVDEKTIGTVSRDGNKVYTLFVDPDLANRAIGRRLMLHIENLAMREGSDCLETGANITAHGFYHKLGYRDVRQSETEFGFNYILRKPLRSSETGHH